MPMLIPFIPAITAGLGLGGAVASTVGSALGSRAKTTTSTPTLSPELQAAESGNLNYLTGIRDNPGAGLEPIKSAATTSINRNYSLLPKLAASKLAARGFGSSGKVGDAVFDTEGARMSDLSGLYGKMAELGSNRQMSAAQIIEQMINSGRGTSTTAPGNVAGNTLTTGGNALGNLSILSTLAAMMRGGGGIPIGGGPAGNPAGSGIDPALLTGEGWGG